MTSFGISSKNKVFPICSKITTNLTITKGDSVVSKELSLHPVHLTTVDEGELPPSAFAPFCFYQGDSKPLGQSRPELNNMTVCDKFEPTILEGQFCYSLNLARVVKWSTKAGKTNGLWVLIDPNPFKLNVSNEMKPNDQTLQQEQFKVYVHTLAQYTAYGPGAYAMAALKRMKGTESFEQLPDSQKNCQVHNREECETKRFMDRIHTKCNCVPWTLDADASIKEAEVLH